MPEHTCHLINRRTFLATTAASIATATAHGERTPPLRVGLLGCGTVGSRIQEIVNGANAPAEIVAAADLDARRLTNLPGAIRKSARWQAVVADRRVDAVAIALSAKDHVEMAQSALNAGKHVYLAPVSPPSSTSARRLFDTASATSSDLRIALDTNAMAHWTAYKAALGGRPIDSVRWIQADIAVPLSLVKRALTSSLLAFMDVFDLSEPRQSELYGGIFSDPTDETPDTLCYSATFGESIRLNLTARTEGIVALPTTVQCGRDTIELAPHPSPGDLDVADWAADLGHGPQQGRRRLAISTSAQMALGEAWEIFRQRRWS